MDSVRVKSEVSLVCASVCYGEPALKDQNLSVFRRRDEVGGANRIPGWQMSAVCAFTIPSLCAEPREE